MGWTKRQFAEASFADIGFASYTYDVQPEQILQAVQLLDSMVEGWTQLIDISYPIPGSPQYTDITQDTGVPMAANEAIIKNLNLRTALIVGKVLTPDHKALAKTSFDNLLNWASRPAYQMSLPGRMPVGAGNKGWGSISYPFFSAYRRGQYQGLGPTPYIAPTEDA